MGLARFLWLFVLGLTLETCSPLTVPLNCGRPPLLENGDTKETIKYRYEHDERVEYVCQNYYTMMGDPLKTCQNSQWIGHMKCLQPCTVGREAMDQHNIQFRYRGSDKLYIQHGDYVEFSCKRGTTPSGAVRMRQRCDDGVTELPTCI